MRRNALPLSLRALLVRISRTYAMKQRSLLHAEVRGFAYLFWFSAERYVFRLLCTYVDGACVAMSDLENACEKVIGGVRKTSTFLTEDIRKIIAYHEAGHAVTAWFLQHAFPVLKISIVPRSNGALGYAQNLPSEISLAPRQRILDHIAVCLGKLYPLSSSFQVQQNRQF